MRQFLQETRIAAIFARDGAGIVRLQVEPGEDVAPGKLTISARAEEIGDHRGEMDVKVEGEASKIAFNSKYLQDVLQVLDCAQVALETTQPLQPRRPPARRRGDTTSTSSCRCSSSGRPCSHQPRRAERGPHL